MKPLLRLLIATLPLSLACANGTSPALAGLEEARQAEEEREAFDHGHTAWTRILAEHLHGEDFDYGALQRERAAFDAYTLRLALVTPKELATFSEQQRYAFWLNAYNAFTVQKVIDNYPLESIRDLDKLFGAVSVFDNDFIPLAAHHPEGADDALSLNDIEHGILRPRFQDARIHAAVNCASASCPPLRHEAYVASRLDEQLDEQMRAFVNDPVRNALRPERNRIELSKIFDWYAGDFEREAHSVRAYLLRYANDERKPLIERAKLGFGDYDWSLNDHRSEPQSESEGR
ncbi:MAG: DUF547 domain-containing protein [Planctomycetota bacterium]